MAAPGWKSQVHFHPMDQVEKVLGPHKQPTKPLQVLSLALFVMLLGSGLFHSYLYHKFTPVYTETECGNQEPTIDNFTIGVRSIHVGLRIDVTCRNPNPYQIQILSSTPGRVFIGKGSEPLEVGKLEVLPGSFLQEEGSGTVHVRMSTDITGGDADRLLPHFLEDRAVPVTMELQFNVGIAISFGLGSWSTSALFKKDCGLNMAGILVNNFVHNEGSTESKSRLGALVCRESFAGMRIPPVGEVSETLEDGQMGFSAAQVAPTEVAKGEAIKNVSLGIMITLSFGLALALPYHIWYGLQVPSLCATFCATLCALCKGSRALKKADEQARAETRALFGGSETADELEDGTKNSLFLGMAAPLAAMADAAGGRSGKKLSKDDLCPPSPWEALQAMDVKRNASPGRGYSAASDREPPRPRANSRHSDRSRESSAAYKGYSNLRNEADSASVESLDDHKASGPKDKPPRVPTRSPSPSPSPEPEEASRPALTHAASARARGLSELSATPSRASGSQHQHAGNSWPPATEPGPSRGEGMMSRESSRSAFGEPREGGARGRSRSPGGPTKRTPRSSPEYTGPRGPE